MFVSKQTILSLAFGMTTANAWATQSFKSVSAVTPVFNVTKSGEPLAPGYLFLTTTALPYPAAVIITDDGELSWNGATCVQSWDIYEGRTPNNLKYTHLVSNGDSRPRH